MEEIRKLTFGKYKGENILFIIATHIGYIMWCFENLKWFKLNETEQKYYDYLAIAIKKYKMPMTFPIDIMLNHVKDKESLSKLETPLKFIGYDVYVTKELDIYDILQKAGCMMGKTYLDVVKDEQKRFYTETLPGIHHSAMKEIDSMEEWEIDSMNDIMR